MPTRALLVLGFCASVTFAADPPKPKTNPAAKPLTVPQLNPVRVPASAKPLPVAKPEIKSPTVPTLSSIARKKLIDWIPMDFFDVKSGAGGEGASGDSSSSGSDSGSSTGSDSSSSLGDALGLARLRGTGKNPATTGKPPGAGAGQQPDGGPQTGLGPDPGTIPEGGAGAGQGGGGGGDTPMAGGGALAGPPAQGVLNSKWWPVCAFIDPVLSQEEGNAAIKGMVDMANRCGVTIVTFPITIKSNYADDPNQINEAARAKCNIDTGGFAAAGSVTTLVKYPLTAAKMCESKRAKNPGPGEEYDPNTAGCAELRQGSDVDPGAASGGGGPKHGRASAKGGVGASIEVPIGHKADVVSHEALGHSQMGKPNGTRYGLGIGEDKDFVPQPDGDQGKYPNKTDGWSDWGCQVMFSKALDNTKGYRYDPSKQTYYTKINDQNLQYDLFSDPALFGPQRPPPPGGPPQPPPAGEPPRIVFDDGTPKRGGGGTGAGGAGATPPSTGIPNLGKGQQAEAKLGNPPSEDERHKRKPGTTALPPIASGGAPKNTYQGDPPGASSSSASSSPSPQDRLRRAGGDTDSGKAFNPSITYDDAAPKNKGGGSGNGSIASRGKAEAAPGAYPGSSSGGGGGGSGPGDGFSPDGFRATEYDSSTGSGVMSSRIAGNNGGGASGSSIQYDDAAPKGANSTGGGYVGLGRSGSSDNSVPGGGGGSNGRNPASVGNLKPIGSGLQNDFFNAVGDGYEDERELKKRKIQGMALRTPRDPNAKQRELSLGRGPTRAAPPGKR